MSRFVAQCAMRWSDMDAYGHVNNAAYLAYLEQARVSMFFDRYDSSFERGTVVNITKSATVKPVVYHAEPLRIELWIDEIRAASFRSALRRIRSWRAGRDCGDNAGDIRLLVRAPTATHSGGASDAGWLLRRLSSGDERRRRRQRMMTREYDGHGKRKPDIE